MSAVLHGIILAINVKFQDVVIVQNVPVYNNSFKMQNHAEELPRQDQGETQRKNLTETLFETFYKAQSISETVSSFTALRDQVGLQDSCQHREVYKSLSDNVHSRRAKSLWSLLTPLTQRVEYRNGSICLKEKVSAYLLILIYFNYFFICLVEGVLLVSSSTQYQG